MLADDGKGQMRGFLATDESFAFLRELHKRNMLVPVVGNFAGPKALRNVGKVHPGARWNDLGVLPVQRRAVPRS